MPPAGTLSGTLGGTLTEALTGEAFAFMLVLCRCAGAVMLLPGFGATEPPAIIRAGFALALAALLLPGLSTRLPAPPDGFMPLAGMIGGEILAGALLGWLAQLVALALPTAGQLLSLATGHSSILQPDAALGAEALAVGRLFSQAIPVLVLATPLYTLPLRALAESYAVLPAGGAWAGGDLAETAVRAAGTYLADAVTLASPFLLISLVWQAGLALLSRLVPQIQVYFVAMPGQLLGGLLLLGLMTAPLLAAWSLTAQAGFAALP